MAESPSIDPLRSARASVWVAAVARYEQAMRQAAEAAPFSADEVQGLHRAEAAWAHIRQLEREWMDALPVVTVSTCPHCDQPLRLKMDIHGLEGPWWRPEALRPPPSGCRHFRVLRGAVSHHQRPVPVVPFEIRPGPEAPYLLPQLLDVEGMVAVVGSVPMDDGREIFPIAYFLETSASGGRSTAPTAHWPGLLHVFPGADGAASWKHADEHWDFDLAPWHGRGQLRWCLPGSRNTVLNGEGDPFLEVDAEARRGQIVLHRADLASLAPP
jgi:hypothetical protein